MKIPLSLACAIFLPFLATGQDLGGIGSVRTRPLEEAERSLWRQERGFWKFEPDFLLGESDSSITYRRSYLPPFRFTCEIEVLDGIRPRIHFDRYWFGNEGSERHFQMYPNHDKSKKFIYKTGRKYPVQVDITKDRIEVHVEGKLVDSRPIGMDLIPPLEFSAGDYFSKGQVRFWNIVITGIPTEYLPEKP